MLEKIKEAKENIDKELTALRIEEKAHGVRVVVNGHKELLELEISPALITEGDAEMIAELVLSSIRRATAEAARSSEEKMRRTAGMFAPGFPGF